MSGYYFSVFHTFEYLLIYLQSYRIIGFYGNGYAQYIAPSLKEGSGGITLSFRTMKPNALLLLARDTDDKVFLLDKS